MVRTITLLWSLIWVALFAFFVMGVVDIPPPSDPSIKRKIAGRNRTILILLSIGIIILAVLSVFGIGV